MKCKVKREVEMDATTILVNTYVRYWEDAVVDGVEDDSKQPNMPCVVQTVDGELRWRPIIDIETGQIMNWREGTTAEIHYKACDEFACTIMDNLSGDVIDDYEGYVPDFMCPKDSGYGDYIIMDIDENGYIQDWCSADVIEFITNGQ